MASTAIAYHRTVIGSPLESDAHGVRTTDASTDADLVGRARNGDRRAEEIIYRRHVRYVGGAVTRLMRRRPDAEDVVQDAFASAFEDLASLREPEALRGWIAQIAVRLVLRKFRRQRLARALGLDRGTDDASLAALADPDVGPERRAELAGLDRALARLAPELRVVWMLRRVEGWDVDEVARACETSPATVKRRSADADGQLRAILGLSKVPT